MSKIADETTQEVAFADERKHYGHRSAS
jgi:hypothetical protein